MTSNWQQQDWPHFSSTAERPRSADGQFLLAGGMFIGAIKYLGEAEGNQLTADAMSTEALTTSEIEGKVRQRFSLHSEKKVFTIG